MDKIIKNRGIFRKPLILLSLLSGRLYYPFEIIGYLLSGEYGLPSGETLEL
jgi:hypothetical protein